MRILVFSDSHGRVQPMLDALEVYKPQAVFHLGDVTRDGDAVRAACGDLPFYQVAGNCDMGRSDYPEEGVARLDGKTFFYLHGHTQRVKLGLGSALLKAQAMEADVLLFGHTHCPLHRDYDGLLAVNPGAAMDGRAALLLWSAEEPITCLPLSL